LGKGIEKEQLLIPSSLLKVVIGLFLLSFFFGNSYLSSQIMFLQKEGEEILMATGSNNTDFSGTAGTGAPSLRTEVIDKVLKGFAPRKYKFKQAVTISGTNAWKNTFFRADPDVLDSVTGNAVEGIPRGSNFPQMSVTFQEINAWVKKYGAEGIGLYRTEYIFLGRRELPSEDEQYKAYFKVAKEMSPHSVIFRTIDIGGDKFLSRPEVPHEMSPFLGWRAIRFCLARPEVFKVQLKAILRASVNKNVKLMFPMISGIEELRQAKELLDKCKKELKKEGKNFDNDISVGAMIEVPSASVDC